MEKRLAPLPRGETGKKEKKNTPARPGKEGGGAGNDSLENSGFGVPWKKEVAVRCPEGKKRGGFWGKKKRKGKSIVPAKGEKK